MFRLGVDLGGTNIAIGIVNEEFQIIHKDSVPTGATRPAQEIVADIAALCQKVAADAGVAFSDIAAIGIAAPGSIDSKAGTVEYANNLPFRHFPITSLLRENLKTDIPVFVENDANAAAWGEAIAGAAKGTADSVMVTLGTGALSSTTSCSPASTVQARSLATWLSLRTVFPALAVVRDAGRLTPAQRRSFA